MEARLFRRASMHFSMNFSKYKQTESLAKALTVRSKIASLITYTYCASIHDLNDSTKSGKGKPLPDSVNFNPLI